MKHHCHARGCESECPPQHLMCHKHWRMVPLRLQREVWKHYRVGQCDDKRPSSEWFEAAEAAIAAVAKREVELAEEKAKREGLQLGLWNSSSES